MSSRRSRNLSPANLEIMKVVWEKSEVTVNEVFEVINSRRRHKLRCTTIQVQMKRLEGYGWLTPPVCFSGTDRPNTPAAPCPRQHPPGGHRCGTGERRDARARGRSRRFPARRD